MRAPAFPALIALAAALAAPAAGEVPLPFGTPPKPAATVNPAAPAAATAPVSALLEAARADEAAGAVGRAISRLARAMNAGTFDERVPFELGRLLVAAGRGREAVAPLETALRANPGRGAAWHLLGKARLDAGDPGAAQAAFRRARALLPEPGGSLLDASGAAWVSGEGEAARLYALGALARHPASAAALDALTAADRRFGPSPLSRDAYARSPHLSARPDALRILARLDLAAGDAATAECRLATLAGPDGLPLPEDAGLALAARIARGRFDEALSLAVALRDGPAAGAARLAECEALAGLGRNADALLAAGAILAEDPDNARALAVRSVCLARAGRFREALAACRRALLLEPDNAGLAGNAAALEEILEEEK